MILRFVSSSLASGSVLTARSLELGLDSVSPSLSAPPLLARSLSQKINIKDFNNIQVGVSLAQRKLSTNPLHLGGRKGKIDLNEINKLMKRLINPFLQALLISSPCSALLY